MLTNLLPPGKDSTLEDTIKKVTHLLTRLGFTPEPVSWLNPAPDCWSVHLSFQKYSFLSTNGKGTSRRACLASALCEFWERLSTNFFFSDFLLDDTLQSAQFLHYPDEKWFYQSSTNSLVCNSSDGTELLNQKLLHLYNPEGDLTFHHLLDSNSNFQNSGICALPFYSLKTSEKVYFPVSLLNNLYVSNGMAAGNSEAECCSQALSEILERHVKNIIISQGLSLPDVPQSTLIKYPQLSAILKTLSNHQLIVQVKDASLGGRYPVICVLLTNPSNGGVYAAFGANCRFQTAIERTLTELLQGRDLNQLGNFNSPVHDLALVADPFNLESHFINSDGLLSWNMFKDKPDFEFSPWNFTGSTENEYQRLKNIIAESGYEAFRAQYSGPGMYSFRILVPGMSEIYPISDLVWNNRVTGANLRPHLLRLAKMHNKELTAFLDTMEESGINDFQNISELTGILFDEDTCWFSLTVGELKALIYLALKKDKEAYEWCHWCLEFIPLTTNRQRLFHILHAILGFQLAGYSSREFRGNLLRVYSEKEYKEAESIIVGTYTFPGLTFGKNWSYISKKHSELISLYSVFNSSKLSFDTLKI